MRVLILVIASLWATKINAQAGPYAPPVGKNGSTAVFKDSSVFIGWATSATIERGWQDISNQSLGKTTIGDSTSATDQPGVNTIVSLGDGGIATLTFENNIIDGPGSDFAVFENSFDDSFLELAFVEVSSDGVNFFRFDAISLTDPSIQTEGFGNTDATNIYNLAGKYKAQYGTPFDLNELAGLTGLDINNVSHVRIIDVVGSINSSFATFDSQNNIVNDPWPTPFASSGFDLDAVGVINSTVTSVEESVTTINLSIYPTPSSNSIYFDFQEQDNYTFELISLSGKVIFNGILTTNQIDISNLTKGIYLIHIYSSNKYVVKKIIKN